MKFCKDCRHRDLKITDWCSVDAGPKEPDVVTGEIEIGGFVPCRVARGRHGRCGPGATLFEPLPPVPTPVAPPRRSIRAWLAACPLLDNRRMA